jgi:hypothetical protein
MTVATEAQVRMAARLYEARAHTKLLLGDRFKARMAEYGSVLNGIAERESVGVLAAANIACKLVDNPFTKIQLLAAAVELTEPS